MALFRFDIFDGQQELVVGPVDLTDVLAARREAVRISAKMLHDQDGCLSIPKDWRINASDARGALLFQLRFSANEIAAQQNARPRDSLGR